MATESERHAQSILESEGFHVSLIPPGDTRTADFHVTDVDSTYLVEVTGKAESGFLLELLRMAEQKGVADGTRPLSPINTLDGIIRRKAEQLEETPIESDFQILWIAAFHNDWRYLAEILTRTVYGSVLLLSLANARATHEQHECLYYNHFSFNRDRNLHAVVLSNRKGGRIYVNALSPRAQEFRASKLYDLFGDEARLDPSQAPDRTLVVAPEVARSRAGAQWEYIKARYGLMTTVVQSCEWRGVASLPTDS